MSFRGNIDNSSKVLTATSTIKLESTVIMTLQSSNPARMFQENAGSPQEEEQRAPDADFAKRSAKYDGIAKVLFPLSYLLFVVAFFLYYAV